MTLRSDGRLTPPSGSQAEEDARSVVVVPPPAPPRRGRVRVRVRVRRVRVRGRARQGGLGTRAAGAGAGLGAGASEAPVRDSTDGDDDDHHHHLPERRKVPRLTDENVDISNGAALISDGAAADVPMAKEQKARLMMQLFPIDPPTRAALVAGRFNPDLELTMRFKKSLPGLVQHLETKWAVARPHLPAHLIPGTSVLQLYPFEATSAGDARGAWNVHHAGVTATDIFDALGRPAAFRLKYGWVPEAEAALKPPPPCIRRRWPEATTEPRPRGTTSARANALPRRWRWCILPSVRLPCRLTPSGATSAEEEASWVVATLRGRRLDLFSALISCLVGESVAASARREAAAAATTAMSIPSTWWVPGLMSSPRALAPET